MTNALAGIQACLDVTALMNTNWNAANTDNVTPQYRNNWELKWQWRIEGQDLVIFDYTEKVNPTLYATDWYHDVAMSIECYTSGFVPAPLPATAGTAGTQTAHIQNMGNEASRILKANARQAGYAMTYLNASRIQNHDERNAYSLFVDVGLKKINP